jgi:hypothetical protein
VIIIDEAHERNNLTDTAMGLLKKIAKVSVLLFFSIIKLAFLYFMILKINLSVIDYFLIPINRLDAILY